MARPAHARPIKTSRMRVRTPANGTSLTHLRAVFIAATVGKLRVGPAQYLRLLASPRVVERVNARVADIESLVAAHRQGVYRYLCRMVGKADAANDLTQEVF